MVAVKLLSLRAISGDCSDDRAPLGAEFVRYVVHKLEKSGLCFPIPFLGSFSSFGWGWPSRCEVPDPLPCDEDLADWRSPARSTFQQHIDLFDVLLGPFLKLAVSSSTWESTSSFDLGVLPCHVVEQIVERF